MNDLILKAFNGRVDLALHFSFSLAGTLAIFTIFPIPFLAFMGMFVIGLIKEVFDEPFDKVDVLYNLYGGVVAVICMWLGGHI